MWPGVFGVPAVELDSVVADTQETPLCAVPLSASQRLLGVGPLSREECEMLQRRAIVLQCFVLLYKKEEINTHFLLHALGSIPPPRPPRPAGEAQLCSTEIHPLSGHKHKPLVLH